MTALMGQDLAGSGSLGGSGCEAAPPVTKSAAGNGHWLLAGCRGCQLLGQKSLGKIPAHRDHPVRPSDASCPPKGQATAGVAAGCGIYVKDAPLRFDARLTVDPQTGSSSLPHKPAGKEIIPHKSPPEPIR